MPFFKKLASNSGFSIAGAVLSGVLIIANIAFYSISQNGTTRNQNIQRQRFLANAYAVELLELFRSFDNGAAFINNYLRLNRPGQVAGYNLCDEINVLANRNSPASITRPDSVADLGANALDQEDATLKSHRSYRIQLIDATTLEVLNTPICNAVPTAITIDGLPNPQFDSALLAITVSVSWIPKGGGIADEQKIEASTVLPVLGRTNPLGGNTS